MENTCEPVEKLQVENIDSYSSIISADDVANIPMPEENIGELIQEQVQEKTTTSDEQIQETNGADVSNISENVDSGFCADTQNLVDDGVEANVTKQSEHEFSSSDLVTTSSGEVDTNHTESGICDSLCHEENEENATQFTCEELLSEETATVVPLPVNSVETDLNELKGEVCDSTAVEENVNSVCVVQDVESSTLPDSDQIVLSVAEIQSPDHLIKSETEHNISDTSNSVFTTVTKENETEDNELTSVEAEVEMDHKEHPGILSDAHVIVNDNIIIPVSSGQTVLDETEGHFIVQEDGTIQKINDSDESDMPHNGVCVAIDQRNFENENALLVIEEIASNETEITAGSNENVECTSSDIVEEQLSSLISGVTPEDKETHEKTLQESSPDVKNVIKKVSVPVPDQIITDSGKPLKIPAHVLGRNIDNPVNDLVANRKVPPKPRLGVKIPYRNLTSQIVSKQEIANVIMERSRLRNAAYDPPVGGDVFFAKKLTQRLARKLAPNTKEESKNDNKLSQTTSKKIMKSYNTRIENDSDLLAILEGDGDDTVKSTANAQKHTAQKATKLDPETEKLIALKQLQQLPKRKKTDSILSSANTSKEFNQKAPIQVSEQSKKSDSEKNKKEPVKKDDKTVVPIKDMSKNKTSAKDEVVESRFASNVPLKTYARKRKNSDEKSMSLDDDSELENKIEKKSDANLPPDTYVTKSSRVIKKKIIWDPDEAVPYSTKIVSKQVSPEKKNEKLEKKYDKSPEKPLEIKPDKTESKSETKKSEQKVATIGKVEKKVVKPPEKKVTNKSNEKPIEEVVSDSDKKKKNIILVKKKNTYRSEVDKLLMDEGAINMLYQVKNDEQNQCRTSKRKSLVNKANEIKSDLESSSNKESPKSLRKKNSPSAAVTNAKSVTPEAVTRKKSRDSIRSSVHTPPASPSYSFPAEASRIIRRHSSSSFDDSEEEDEETENNEGKQTERVTRKRSSGNTLTVTKTKKLKRSQAKENLTVNEKNKLNEEMSKNFNNLVASSAESAEELGESFKLGQFKKLSVTKIDKLVCVTINAPKKTCTLSMEILKELCKVLVMVEKDDSCNALVLNSNGESFCHGIDYKQLVAENEEVRKKIVTEMANCIYNFLKSLVDFSKIIVAGVHGDVVGIGVTMLPLFDMVFASDESTFSIPCSKLGSIAEGSFVLSHFKSYALASELLFASQILTSDEAVQRCLITRTVWREKFMEELNTVAHSISENSRQGMEVTKKMLRKHISSTIEDDIKMEKNILIEHWLTEECQKNFSRYKVE